MEYIHRETGNAVINRQLRCMPMNAKESLEKLLRRLPLGSESSLLIRWARGQETTNLSVTGSDYWKNFDAKEKLCRSILRLVTIGLAFSFLFYFVSDYFIPAIVDSGALGEDNTVVKQDRIYLQFLFGFFISAYLSNVIYLSKGATGIVHVAFGGISKPVVRHLVTLICASILIFFLFLVFDIFVDELYDLVLRLPPLSWDVPAEVEPETDIIIGALFGVVIGTPLLILELIFQSLDPLGTEIYGL